MEKAFALIELAERKGWGIVGVGEIFNEVGVGELFEGVNGLSEKWRWVGKKSKEVEGRRGLGMFVRKELFARIRLCGGEGAGGGEHLWIRVVGTRGGEDTFICFCILCAGYMAEKGD